MTAATRPICWKRHTKGRKQRMQEREGGGRAREQKNAWKEKVIVNKNSTDEIKRNKMNGKRLMVIYCVFQS